MNSSVYEIDHDTVDTDMMEHLTDVSKCCSVRPASCSTHIEAHWPCVNNNALPRHYDVHCPKNRTAQLAGIGTPRRCQRTCWAPNEHAGPGAADLEPLRLSQLLEDALLHKLEAGLAPALQLAQPPHAQLWVKEAARNATWLNLADMRDGRSSADKSSSLCRGRLL